MASKPLLFFFPAKKRGDVEAPAHDAPSHHGIEEAPRTHHHQMGAALSQDEQPRAAGLKKPPVVRLKHLTGTRFAASLWIVCQHFAPHSKRGRLVKVLWRSNAAVDYFIVLSGFVTHWASRGRFSSQKEEEEGRRREQKPPSKKQTHEKTALTSFYARRFGRVLLTTYLSMILATGILMYDRRWAELRFGHVCRCFLLVEPWFSPERWCPNGQTWTIAALLPAWLSYPLMDKCVYSKRRQVTSLLALFVFAASAPTVAVSLVALCLNNETNNATRRILLRRRLTSVQQRTSWAFTATDHAYSYFFPPSQLLDFFLGVVAAELAARRASSSSSWSSRFDARPSRCVYGAQRLAPDEADELKALSSNGREEDASPDDARNGLSSGRFLENHGRAADVVFLVIVLVVCFAPNPGLAYRTGYEGLFDHGLAPFFALFLYFSAVDASPPLPRHTERAHLEDDDDDDVNKDAQKPALRRTTTSSSKQQSLAAAVFAHPALDALGTCSFEVYLFQWPLHAIFENILGLPTKGRHGENFMAYAISLWFLSALYEIHLERPFVAWLRRVAAPPTAPSSSSSSSSSS